MDKVDKLKKKYMKMINSGKSFKEVFDKVSKSNDYDIFENILLSDKLPENFESDIFTNYAYNTMFEVSVAANNTKEAKYLKKVYIDKIAKNFSKEVSDKLKVLYKDNNIKLFDMYRLANANCNGQLESEKVSDLIDLLTDSSINVGIHRTHNYDIGDDIVKEGLDLTAHSSAGVFIDTNDMSVKRQLSDNITVNTSIDGIYDIMVGGTYKNYINPETGTYFFNNVDIVITAIPKDLLDSNSPDIIINNDGLKKLNPKYVKGYYTVHPDDETLSLGEYTPNDKCVVSERKIDVSSQGEISSYWDNLFISRKKNSFSLKDRFKSLFSKRKKLDPPKTYLDDTSEVKTCNSNTFYNDLKGQVVPKNEISDLEYYNNDDRQRENEQKKDIKRR